MLVVPAAVLCVFAVSWVCDFRSTEKKGTHELWDAALWSKLWSETTFWATGRILWTFVAFFYYYFWLLCWKLRVKDRDTVRSGAGGCTRSARYDGTLLLFILIIFRSKCWARNSCDAGTRECILWNGKKKGYANPRESTKQPSSTYFCVAMCGGRWVWAKINSKLAKMALHFLWIFPRDCQELWSLARK